MTLSDEHELLARAQASADGFGELFDRYYERVYAYAYRRVGTRATAEDIAACTFEDALRGIHRLRWRGKPVIAWLYRIAARRVADHYRRNGQPATSNSETLPDPENAAESALERTERQQLVRQGLEKLNAKDREIIRLVYFDELDSAQVAAMLDCTTNSVYVRLHRALKRLQVILEQGE